MRDARHRLLGPMNAGLDLPHPAGQRVLALIEPGDVLTLACQLARLLAEFDVAPHRHPVADVVGEQAEPIVVAAFVQQLGFAIEEFGDFLGQQKARDPLVLVERAITHGATPPRPSLPIPARRPETPPAPSRAPGRADTSRTPIRRAAPAPRPRGPARRRGRYPWRRCPRCRRR